MRLEPRSRELLLDTAAGAIEAGLARAEPGQPALAGLPPDLLQSRASFVTLTIDGQLRGCCGSLEPRQALATDVWRNAQASAFRDPRFSPLEPREWEVADLEIAVLSPLEPVRAVSESELIRELRPAEDGLVIAWGGSRATFLPKVWEHFDTPREFLLHLKRKAGWHDGFWAADVVACRYRTETFSATRPAARQPIGRS